MSDKTKHLGPFPEYHFNVEWFKADDTIDEFIKEQAHTRTTKQNYLLDVFTNLQQYGFVIRRPITSDLITSLKQHIKVLEEQLNGRT